jgi:hypothetical protein
MFRNRKLTLALLLALLAGSGHYSLASDGGSTNGSGSNGTSPGISTNGITGTDPEPISPTIVTVILTILNL